jgi:hypothetical protein
MEIHGIDGMTVADLQKEIRDGGRFVIFQYCISILVITFRRTSDIYFIKKGQSTLGISLPFTFISILLGWWGIPWGPIYTIGSIATNIDGGKDITQSVLQNIIVSSQNKASEDKIISPIINENVNIAPHVKTIDKKTNSNIKEKLANLYLPEETISKIEPYKDEIFTHLFNKEGLDNVSANFARKAQVNPKDVEIYIAKNIFSYKKPTN